MMLVDGELREVPVGAVAYDREAGTWIFDHGEADVRAQRSPAAITRVPDEIVEVWEDATGALSIHVEGDPLAYLVGVAAEGTFDRDVAALLAGDQDLIAERWRTVHWSEHADRVADADGPRLVVVWDAGQVQILRPGEHPYGQAPGRAAQRYLGRREG
jgi:hypothetical protein